MRDLVGTVGTMLRRPGLAWPGFFLLCAAAWAGLLVLSLAHPAPESALGALAPSFDAEFWRALCAVNPAGAGFGTLVLMWAVMAAAMMAPTAAPFLSDLRAMMAGQGDAGATFAAVIAGYLSVWLGYAVLAAGAQWMLARAGVLSPHGVLIAPWLTALLLALAGAYQFTTLKHACLARCRAPLRFLFDHYRPGVGGALRMGVLHGALCVGCCWALMLLGFVGGTMNLVWMGGAMVLMTLEKMPAFGAPLTRPLGWVLLLAAVWMAMRAAM